MAFLGMVGTGEFDANERPKNWREKILELFPNGDAPLTAIMSKLKSEATDDAEFKWFEKDLAAQAGTITEIYTDVNMQTAYTTGAIAGMTLYVKVALAFAQECRAGHQLLLRDTTDVTKDINCKILDTLENGAASMITIKLLEAEQTADDLADVDRALIIGNINPEGGDMPPGISYGQENVYNYTQIFRTSLSITRTAKKTKLRIGDKYVIMKKDALQYHSIEMEKSLIWSIRTENTGANGKPERTSGGLMYFIRNYDGIIDDYRTSDDVTAGTAWLSGGEDWLNEQLRKIFRYGSRERLAFVGDKTVLAIQQLIKNSAGITYALSVSTESYGLAVTKWVTPFGTIQMMTHPLFSYEVTNQKSMLLLDVSKMRYRYIDDTAFYKDGVQQNTGYLRRDSTDEEWLTEAGYEFHHAKCFGFLDGFGEAREN